MTEFDPSAEGSRIREEILRRQKETAELLQQLASIGIQGSQAVVEERQADYAKKVAQAEQKKEDAALIDTFVRSLPQASITGKYRQDYVFPVPDLNAARLLEATVWGYKWPDRTDNIGPVYIVGQKTLRVKRDRSDAIMELLLASASSDSETRYLKVRTTTRLWQRTEELTTKGLTDPIPKTEIDKYLSADKSRFELHKRENNPHQLSNGRYFPKRLTDNPLLKDGGYKASWFIREPKTGLLKGVFWEKIDRSLIDQGLPVEVQKNWDRNIDFVVPDRRTVTEYGMNIACQKLAVQFGTEDVLEYTLGVLGQKANFLED